MTKRIASFWSDDRGAIAATYAMSLIGLVAVAGVAFDYSRMAGLDSELQNGADQAALAGATQLDRESGACARAANAAIGMLSNITLLANDGAGIPVTINADGASFSGADACTGIDGITFLQSDQVTEAETDAAVRFIKVTVDARRANYAFTPIVGALYADLAASAMAGVGSAICRVPPVMFCNPAEPVGNTEVTLPFNADSYVGIGMKLVANDAYTPGSFGFLETEFGTGANGLLAALGWDIRGGNCLSIDGVEIKNGMNASVMDGLNTRFDLPGTGTSCPNVNQGGTTVSGTCSPSVNSRKDLVRQANGCNWGQSASNAANAQTANYRPSSPVALAASLTPEIMGHPRDMCHAISNDGVCNSYNGGQGPRIGTGDWDVNAYWRSNYGTNYPAGTIDALTYGVQPKGYPTRYQVYRWEAERIAAGTLSPATAVIKTTGSPPRTAYAQPQANRCLATSSAPYGLVPGTDTDRRRISIAVLNCRALQAQGNLNSRTLRPAGWVDVFLVEPSETRRYCTSGSGCNTIMTEKTDVYVEIIGKTQLGSGGGTTQQTVRRDLPYIVR